MRLSKDEKDFLLRSKGAQDALLAHYRSAREKGIPHAYICGSVEFFDIQLNVSSSCLIPRLETELLVERSLQRLPAAGKVLDLCTGSGAIGLAIKSKSPLLDVVISDISEKALEVAKANIKENNLEVEVVQGDFLHPFSKGEFDGIICNPPYITKDEYEEIDSQVRDYEPKIALTDDLDGLTFYRRLAKEAFDYLKPLGVLCVEIGKDQAEEVCNLFSDKQWSEKVVEKDYSSHDRFIFITRRDVCLLD